MLSNVSEKTFREEVLQSSQPVVVHFWAPWCDLCKMIDPMLEQLQASLDRPLKLVSINADNNFTLANTYRLRTLPTILFFENGYLQKRLDNFKGRDGVFTSLQSLVKQNELGNVRNWNR